MSKELQINWYKELLVDLRKLEFTGIVLTKWNIGKRILADFEKFGMPEYGSKRIENIAKDLEGSSSDLYKCIQFAKKYPKIVTPLQNLSWREVVNKYLPEPRQKEPEIVKLPKGKFNVIYADPAWEYDRTIGQGGTVEQYDLMPLGTIKSLPIQDLSAEDCLLFLWATFPKLIEALEVIKAWGFEYKTVAFTWIKTNKKNNKPFFGIGSYTKSNAEVCLLATKGEPHKLVKDNSISSVIISPLQEHSRKPKEAREKIVKLVGNVPKIELFSREKVEGWKNWGNEIERF